MIGDDAHNLWVAGYEQGLSERFDLEVADAVQVVLHQQVKVMLGLAKQSARHGAAFSQLVRESGERDE
jgi:hypothetical protein